MKYDFDRVTDRSNTNCVKWDVKEGVLPMWIADMDFETAPCVVEALQKRLSNHIYGYSYIPEEWAETLSSWWRNRYNFDAKKEWFIFTTGVVPSISTAVRKFSYAAEKVVVLTPVYNIFFNSIINNGRRILECPLDYKDGEYSINFDRLEECLSDPLTTMLIFCNPHNPCGKIWTKEELAKVGELCKKHGVVVVSDEIHCDLTEPGKKYIPFASASEVCKEISITAVAPGKTFNVAGIHTAAVIIPNKHLYERMNRALNTDEVAEPNTFAIETAIACYSKGSDWVDELREYLWENRRFAEDFIAKNISSLKVVKADATYLMWTDASELGLPSKLLCQKIRKETGLYLSNGEQYGEGGKYFLRLNLACPRSLVEDGMNRLKKAVEVIKTE